jgi:hypothetical protein
MTSPRLRLPPGAGLAPERPVPAAGHGNKATDYLSRTAKISLAKPYGRKFRIHNLHPPKDPLLAGPAGRFPPNSAL